MLTTALQQSIKIDVTEYLGVKEYAYTCYGDSDSKDIFYVVPEIPVFAKRDTNTPSFMFYKYRSEDTQGGYAQFTVQLPQPNAEMKDRIRLQLYNGLGRKDGPLDKKSKLIVDYIKAKQAYEADPENNTKKTAMDQAQKNTGLSDEQLNRFVALYDGNKGDDQFLSELMPADAAKIELMQPRYTSAQAMLILDGNDKFYRQIPTPLSPSGLGDNNTVFSLSLTGEGATLFEQVLKGTDKNASVGVRFDLSLDASMSAAKVIVTYNSEQAKSVAQTINYHTWSADEKKIEQEFYAKEAIKVDVRIGLTAQEMGMEPAAYDKWKESLRNWGQQQVEQILSSQTGIDMSLNLLNDAGSFEKFQSKISQTLSFTREYEENAVVSSTIYPQTQLPSIRSIVGEADLDQYFKEYDLHDPFYQYIQPEFFVTEDMAKYDIANIVVTAIYDDDLKSTLTFTPKDPGPKKTDKWFIKTRARPRLPLSLHRQLHRHAGQTLPVWGHPGQRRSGGHHQRGAKRHRLRRYLHPAQPAGLGGLQPGRGQDPVRRQRAQRAAQAIHPGDQRQEPAGAVYLSDRHQRGKAALLFGRLLCAGRRQPDLPPAGRGKQPAAARLWRNARQSDPDRQRPAEAAEIHHHLQTVAKRRFADHLRDDGELPEMGLLANAAHCVNRVRHQVTHAVPDIQPDAARERQRAADQLHRHGLLRR